MRVIVLTKESDFVAKGHFFPVGTKIRVTTEKAISLISEGIAELDEGEDPLPKPAQQRARKPRKPKKNTTKKK